MCSLVWSHCDFYSEILIILLILTFPATTEHLRLGNVSMKTDEQEIPGRITGQELSKPDMENVRNFTRAGLLVSRFYPKVRELCQF